MLEWVELTIPAQTAKADPVENRFKASKGHITDIYIGFPDGCADYVHVQVWLNEIQVCPWTRGEWVRGNDYVYHIPCNIPIDTEPYNITAKGYSEDDSHDHTIWAGVNWESEDPNYLRRFIEAMTTGYPPLP